MKNTYLTMLLLVSFLSFGQKKNSRQDEILFEKAVTLHALVYDDLNLDFHIKEADSTDEKAVYAKEIKETILEKALVVYNQLIDSFPKSKLVYRALNNKGFIEVELDDLGEAKKTYLSILNSPANDKERGGVGSGIMGEPYANYKNRAAKQLAEIAIKQENYQEALGFLEQTKTHKYQHFCGNEYAADEIYTVTAYAKCYNGLQQTEKAYETLLPYIIENGLADNSDLVDFAIKMLLERYKKDELKQKFEEAFKNAIVEKGKGGDGTDRYYIDFLNTKIQIDSWMIASGDASERNKELNATMIESGFYKRLSQ